MVLRAAYGALLLTCGSAPDGADGVRVPYAGPDRTHTLPETEPWMQFCDTWESSHSVSPTGWTEKGARKAPRG
ncbi:hypothetical protein GCM10023079_35540 [Streptomyces chitinivorans]